MTTSYHTAIATGAAANAATFNTPLGTLDAELVSLNDDIGTLASLTTTAKTSLVAAINEVDGAITAPASPNLAWDAFNRYYAPTTAEQEGRTRWHVGTGTRVVDSAALYSGYVTRITGTNNEGRMLWLDDMGVKVGDVTSFAAYALVPTGRSVLVTVAFLDSSSNVLASDVSTTVAGDDAAHLMTVENQTVPASCVKVSVIVTQVSGTGTVDVYAWYAFHATAVRDAMLAEGIAPGQQAFSSIVQATTANATLEATIARNLAADPFFEIWEIDSTHEQDGTIRFEGVTVSHDAFDTDNPFGGRTLVHPGDTVGINYLISELGAVVGETLTFGAIVKGTAAETWTIAYVYRDAAGDVTGLATSSTYTATGEIELLQISAVIPADTVLVNVRFARVSGSHDLSIYAMHISKTETLSLEHCTRQAYARRFQDGVLLHRDRKPDPVVGIENLVSWRGVQAALYEAEADRHARIAIIGDSYVNGNDRWKRQFTTRIQADLGGGAYGAGFLSSYRTHYEALLAGVGTTWPKLTDVTRTGTWTEHDPGTTPAGKGVDLCDATSTADEDRYDIEGTFDTVVIHYLKQSGGGTFKTSKDEGSNWSANIDTANASDLFATATVTGCTDKIRVQANGATVTLLGFELYDTSVTNGAVVHGLGHSGATTLQWNTASATVPWKAAMTQLEPDLVIIWLGANDIGGVGEYTWQGRIKTLMDDIRSAVATVDMLLIAPPEFASSETYQVAFSSYSRRMRELAMDYPCGFIDMNAFVTHTKGDPLGLWEDTVHFNEYGGALAGSVIFRALKW